MKLTVGFFVKMNIVIASLAALAGTAYLILFIVSTNLPSMIFYDEIFQTFNLPAFFAMTMFAGCLAGASISWRTKRPYGVRQVFLFLSAMIAGMLLWQIIVLNWIEWPEITLNDILVLSPFALYFVYMVWQLCYLNNRKVRDVFS